MRIDKDLLYRQSACPSGMMSIRLVSLSIHTGVSSEEGPQALWFDARKAAMLEAIAGQS
jgi:hypothetical protein